MASNISELIIHKHNVEESTWPEFKDYVAELTGLSGDMLEDAADAMWWHCEKLVENNSVVVEV